MNPANSKTFVMLHPTTAITAASVNFGRVDTKGFDYLTIDVVGISASAATQVTALGVGEDDTAATAFTDTGVSRIVALTGGTATSSTAGFVLPTPQSAGAYGNRYRFNVDLRGRKRYIVVDYQPAVTDQACIIAHLYKCEDGPADTTSTIVTAGVDFSRLIASA